MCIRDRHNRECPKCGKIGVWNWARKRELKTMPNGETVRVKVICKGEPAIKCNCGHKFEPHSHARLDRALTRVMKEIEK